MSVANALLKKSVELTELQKRALAMQRQSAKHGGVSNLFVNRQTDYSKSFKAQLAASRSLKALWENKADAVTRLIGMQALMSDPNSINGKASGAKVRNRISTMYTSERDKRLQRYADAEAKRERKAARKHEAAELDMPTVSESGAIIEPVVAPVSVPAPVVSTVVSVPSARLAVKGVRISIRV